jgi:hypothetical protein
LGPFANGWRTHDCPKSIEAMSGSELSHRRIKPLGATLERRRWEQLPSRRLR